MENPQAIFFVDVMEDSVLENTKKIQKASRSCGKIRKNGGGSCMGKHLWVIAIALLLIYVLCNLRITVTLTPVIQ